MGTLVSILLALVMEILAPTSLSSSEVKESINRIEVEEVILYFEELPTVTSIYFEELPTVTSIKNC